MKKYGLVIVLSIVLIGSAIVNYGQFNKLTDAQMKNETLAESLAERDNENKTLVASVSSLDSQANQLEKDLKEANQQRVVHEEALQVIDTKLKANGEIIKTIDQLQRDNKQWREELNKMSLKVKALESKTSTEPDEPVLEPTTKDDSWKQSVSDIQGIVTFIENRIGELDEAVSNLPTLSLERLMVQQEINFLKTTQSELEQVSDELAEANK